MVAKFLGVGQGRREGEMGVDCIELTPWDLKACGNAVIDCLREQLRIGLEVIALCVPVFRVITDPGRRVSWDVITRHQA